MTTTKRALIARSGIALLSAGALSLALATPSLASSPQTTTPNAAAAAEASASAAVATFDSTHALPVVTSTSSATYARQTAAAVAFWRAAPVSQMAAQYGCTVSGVKVAQSPTSDGVEHAQVTAAVSCPGGAVMPLTAMVAPRFAASAGSTSALAQPDATYGGCSSHSAYCIYGYFPSGELEEYYQYQGTSSFTGHVRDGRGADCGPGTLLANSTNEKLTHDEYIDLINYDYTLDSTYSDENVTSGGTVGGIFCETF